MLTRGADAYPSKSEKPRSHRHLIDPNPRASWRRNVHRFQRLNSRTAKASPRVLTRVRGVIFSNNHVHRRRRRRHRHRHRRVMRINNTRSRVSSQVANAADFSPGHCIIFPRWLRNRAGVLRNRVTWRRTTQRFLDREPFVFTLFSHQVWKTNWI